METTQEWKIGDCLDLLPAIEDGSVDMILTDLPYGQTKNDWDVEIDPVALWEYYNRIVKSDGVIILFGQGMFTSVMMQINVEMWKYNLVWNKVLKTGHLNTESMPLRQHEDLMVFYHASPTYNPQKTMGKKNHSKRIKPAVNNNYGAFDPVDNSNSLGCLKFPGSILEFEKPHPSVCVHPTQKPLGLIEYLIKTYTNKGDTVHDSCLGSGTTLEACMNTDRNCIGFEICNEWEHHYKKRLHSDNTKLTDNWTTNQTHDTN